MTKYDKAVRYITNRRRLEPFHLWLRMLFREQPNVDITVLDNGSPRKWLYPCLIVRAWRIEAPFYVVGTFYIEPDGTYEAFIGPGSEQLHLPRKQNVA